MKTDYLIDFHQFSAQLNQNQGATSMTSYGSKNEELDKNVSHCLKQINNLACKIENMES